MKRFWIRAACMVLFSLCDPSSVLPQEGALQDDTQGNSQEDLEVENGDPGDGDGSVPVDGGLSLLLAAGAAYGAYRLGNRHPKALKMPCRIAKRNLS
jgi:hypothetical protein